MRGSDGMQEALFTVAKLEDFVPADHPRQHHRSRPAAVQEEPPQCSIVDAAIIAALSSTKNQEGERDPQMHQTKKGSQWHFGMKAHIAVDVDSGLVHTVTTTVANESDVEQVADLLHSKEEQVWADSGYRGAQTRVDREVRWHIAAWPSDIAKLPEGEGRPQRRSASSARSACAPRSSIRSE